MPNELKSPGLIEDSRSEIDKQKDYQHEEVAPQAVVLNWNRDISGAPKYSVRDQNGSSSCVGQAIAKALETMTGVVQSAHPPYRRRANYPNLGMWLQDGGNIITHLGTTTELLDHSQIMSEAEMNKDIFVETPLKEATYITANFRDIDTIATAIETQKHCIITIQSDYNEWDVVKPVVLLQPTTFGHAICATYYFTDENGIKCLVIDESWGLKSIRQRIITEDFLKARGTGAMYFIPSLPLPAPQKPSYRFTEPLQYGVAGEEVRILQDALKYFGFFPTSLQSTGNYLQITAKALLAWQIANNVASIQELNSLQGRKFGQKSIAKMNLLLNN